MGKVQNTVFTLKSELSLCFRLPLYCGPTTRQYMSQFRILSGIFLDFNTKPHVINKFIQRPNVNWTVWELCT